MAFWLICMTWQKENDGSGGIFNSHIDFYTILYSMSWEVCICSVLEFGSHEICSDHTDQTKTPELTHYTCHNTLNLSLSRVWIIVLFASKHHNEFLVPWLLEMHQGCIRGNLWWLSGQMNKFNTIATCYHNYLHKTEL